MEYDNLKNKCREAIDLIQKSLDETLSVDERRQLDAHIDNCEECRSAFEEYRLLASFSKEWITSGITDPGDEFTDRVMMLIAEENKSELPVSTRPQAPVKGYLASLLSSRWIPVYAFCCVAIILVVASIYYPMVNTKDMANMLPHLTETAAVPRVETAPIHMNVDYSSMVIKESNNMMQNINGAFDNISSLHISVTWAIYALVAAIIGNLVLLYDARSNNRRSAA